MKNQMKSHEIRQSFLDYFQKNGHQVESSSRLIPDGDPTLLFTNAGMNQFKNLFLGLEARRYKRAATSQKCVRAGGKHNDLENVGHTARHHTFFEMLGNFSFGDYFKKDAIHFAWDYVTKVAGLPKDKLYVSVFENDDEAADIWHKQEGVARDRIFRFGEKDNFWRMGDSGPCGPCSEIFYDLGPEVGGDPKENVMGGSGDRFIEFWNLVFMQFQEDGKGGRTPLPNPSIDTGMGLERLTTILQGQLSNYHTDLFLDLMAVAGCIAKKEYVKDISRLKGADHRRQDELNVALRVLADHARASAFLIADGVLPSNDGRGYVLRRILRRAIRFGRKLSEDQSLLPAVVEKVIEKMGSHYPELKTQSTLVKSTVRDEETRFLTTLDQGTQILHEELTKIESHGGRVVPGETLFKLYDTFGFPLDLTRLMAGEKGFSVDESGFEKKMEDARAKARASWKGKGLTSDQTHLIKEAQEIFNSRGATQFEGYQQTSSHEASILWLSNGSSKQNKLTKETSGLLVTNKTPFYAESGGQVGDQGFIHGAGGQAEVLDTTKHHDVFVHHIRVTDGEFCLNEKVHLQVTESSRRSTANNHSATHLMHSALRKVLGPHVTQAGSLVDAERLRFDFTHSKPLTTEEVEQIELLVNQEISLARMVDTKVMSPNEAIKAGAMALFGEKYGDQVRVVRMGDFSMELCGGTHVGNTSQIRLFKITSEGGVSAGVRRIEAVTGEVAVQMALAAMRELKLAEEASGLRGAQNATGGLLKWIEAMKEEKKNLEKQLQQAKSQQVDLEKILNQSEEFSRGGKKGRLVIADVAVDDRKILRDLSDRLRDRVTTGVVVMLGQDPNNASHPLIITVSKDLLPDLSAAKILSDVAAALGGKGGGKPDLAQGAIVNRSQVATELKRLFT